MSGIRSLRDGGQPPQRRTTSKLREPVSTQTAPQTGSLANDGWAPPALRSLEDTGLSKLAVADLILKMLYFRGDLTGSQISELVRLPFNGIVDDIIRFLRDEQLIEVMGGAGIGDASWRYNISSKGIERAIDALKRTQYAGPAPVPLDQYIGSIKAQNRKDRLVTEDDMRKVLDNLIVSKEMLDRIGPAANSGTSIFLFGPPGNGKTVLSESIGRAILGDDIWIPYAVDIDGQIVQLYDSVNHELAENQAAVRYGVGSVADTRWVHIKRPIIIVGGELTMESLDLVYDENNRFYEAPYQVKANGGLFLIDDFGRQQVRPQELLNRWIVPLEKKYDFLNLNNGRKVEIPFNVLIIFSTNMDPKDLVDDAFLRRIKYKIEVGNPTLEEFREVFQLMCRVRGVPYDHEGLKYLIMQWYRKQNRDLRFVHPRDLLSQMQDIARYLGRPATMADTDLIDRAAASYFVEL